MASLLMATAPIGGEGLTVQQLFSRFQFKLDPYQREYSWGRKEVGALVTDLTRHFLADWKPGDERKSVRHYGAYFLGPFVYYDDDGLQSLVDGQQRVSTLHLILIQLRRIAIDSKIDDYERDAEAIEPLVAGYLYGERSYTIRSDERKPLLDAIYEGDDYEVPTDATPSVYNLSQRYGDIIDFVPEHVRDEALPLFIHWLMHRVCLVGINAVDRRQGWEIFETMNDRGMQLSPADLLKSYLLRKAKNSDNLGRLGEAWRNVVAEVHQLDSIGMADFVQVLLIGRYASEYKDAENVIVSFHGWVQENAAGKMGLCNPADYARFIEHDLMRLVKRYKTVRAACERFDPDLEHIYYNSYNEIDQMPFLMAAFDPADTDAQFRAKCKVVGGFLDLIFAQSIVNNSVMKSSAFNATLFDIIVGLRACQYVDEVTAFLGRHPLIADLDFSALRTYGLRPDNRSHVRYLLARITAFVEVECGKPNEIASYLDRSAPYEIEHIWADKFVRYQALVRTESDFRIYRNRFGALLLLRKSHNASYQDAPYEKKIEWYRSTNHLAASLHKATHERNRPFTEGVVRKHSLQKVFRPFGQFDLQAIETRQSLYFRLFELVWNPVDLGITGSESTNKSGDSVSVVSRTRAHYSGVTVASLVQVGFLRAGEQIHLRYKGIQYVAEVTTAGQVGLPTGECFNSPSPAAATVIGRGAVNGWAVWRAIREGRPVNLAEIRAAALESGVLDAAV
ncbi:GmrSD restriction endonuclease domain-containing protein [Micromonospora sp. NBC_01813]|uniref:GmrSD restriction endonuclease domain-containing protein n=1 Tax=Micromonospora sp. NBC_01813 TaxID=2975988 RepID=UPI002DD9A25C|nr:DUF262 domain-containing protein [Micromonospora sp. NBC_01813]WSA12301.1 DUF262 domain-containing protein [Micromonospora sp. NBC_01813]